ncbi:DUF4439 domain-containing protein [uncultured Nocardioides sp.]|uniref:DUF4439 domain-containing protein n=1 Tax=uncultured Nocardioides sp. TaxID=198441 RepID=UPI0026048E71|nr:DUF4439 domain-containing protein [uncultured Nocardioides sp.]
MPDRQPPGPAHGLPRRAVLGVAGGLLGLAVAGLTGCGVRGSGAGSGAGPATDTVPGDDDVLGDALALTEDLAARVRATVRRHPGLRSDLGALRDLHAAHDAELRPEDTPSGPSGPGDAEEVPARPPRARAAVLAAEREAVLAYADLAAASESGRLARLLASVAAGLAQRLTVLDPTGDAVLPRPAGVPVSAPGLPADAVEALQLALGAEHAAVFTLAVVGARTSSSASPDLYADVDGAYGVHLARRDALTDALRAAGEEPVAAAPSYELPAVGASGDESGARDAARGVEDGCATTYAYLVAGTTGEVRTWAVRALVDASLVRLGLGGEPQDLPGL